MASESRRKSLLAIVEEVTEGTPVLPSSGGDFIALQQGFSLQSDPQTEESEEILGTTGAAAPIVKKSKASGTISQYVHGSGVIGTPPKLGKFCEGALGAVVAAHGTDRTTTTGSTAGDASTNAVLKLGAGGSDFERGKMVIYDRSIIRNVLSVSSNDLTTAFNFASAPVTGKKTGRATLYKPSDLRKSYSLIEYMANGLGIQLAAGMKIDSATFSIQANKPLKATFSFKGSSHYFDPIELTSSNNKLDLNDGTTDFNITVPAGIYKDPHELAQAVEDAVSSAAYTNATTLKYNDEGANAGKFTFDFAAGTNSLEWATGTNTAQTIGGVLGYNVASDDTGSSSYTSDSVQDWAAQFTPSVESITSPLVVTDTEMLIGTRDRISCPGVRTSEIKLTNTYKEDEFVCGNDEKTLTGMVVEIQNNLRATRHDAMYFRKLRTGENVQYQFSAGRKQASRWVEASIFNAFSPQMIVSGATVVGDETVDIDLGLKAYVSADQLREFYINFG